jgi:hypothetical protein
LFAFATWTAADDAGFWSAAGVAGGGNGAARGGATAPIIV